MNDDLELPEPYFESSERSFDVTREQHVRSQLSSQRAFAASSRSDWLTAARAFVDAALEILNESKTPSGQIAQRNRGVFYRNAAACFERAAVRNEARVVFEDLAFRDPYNVTLLRRLGARFAEP